MAFAENLDVFFDDFAVAVTVGATSGLGILDMPDQVIGGIAISTEYSLTVRANVFPPMERGDDITVDSIGYKVREYRLQDDGKLAKVSLSKT